LANELIGQPYGLTYEIVDKKLEYLPPRTLEDVGMCKQPPYFVFPIINMTEDTDATNELINDGEFVQPLTVEDIQALKQSGVHASVCKDFRSLLYISL
jgi:tRNA (adenine-N(1)-)-methyltransferase non-catalytic subunit